jgi:hypothetical protein
LANVVGVYLDQVSLLLIGQQGLVDLQVSALASHWMEDYANITLTPEENNQYSDNYSQCNTSSKPIHFR